MVRAPGNIYLFKIIIITCLSCFVPFLSSSISPSISLVTEKVEGRRRERKKMIKQKNKWKVDLISEHWTKNWNNSLKSCFVRFLFFKSLWTWGIFFYFFLFLVTIFWNMSFLSKNAFFLFHSSVSFLHMQKTFLPALKPLTMPNSFSAVPSQQNLQLSNLSKFKLPVKVAIVKGFAHESYQ